MKPNDNNPWKECADIDGVPCEYNINTGRVRYPNTNLTQEEIDQILGDLSGDLDPPPAKIICTTCNGTGVYQGLHVKEECDDCQGTGQKSV